MSTSPPLIVADRYRLIAPLGQGGMGRVWRATDVVLHREVAIKELVPPPGLTPEERQEMRERSLREARAIARLNNINVVRVFDVLRTDADPWIVMEYVPSRSLQDIIAQDGPFAPVRAAEIGLGVLNALRAAHRAGVVHRDVKPGNVLISEEGRVVLTDFGLATVPGDPNVTRTGLVLGSPAYIAPERARDGTAGPGADLWSLGATLYAAVEGASPFARPSAIATLAALATENPPPARNAGPLKPVLNGLLRKDPAHRINAEEAERLLLRATGRRSKLSFPMSPTMRRPGIGRERPSGGTTPPVVPGVSASAPVVPGPRPPVTPGRPQGIPAGPPVIPSRAQGTAPRPPGNPGQPPAGGRAPIFAPGKASVGRPPAETPTRVDGPKPPELDATKIENPNRFGTATPSSPPPVGDASASRRPALDATMRGSGSAFGSITADEVAAHRKRPGTHPGQATTPPTPALESRQPATQPPKSPPAAPRAAAAGAAVAEPRSATQSTSGAVPPRTPATGRATATGTARPGAPRQPDSTPRQPDRAPAGTAAASASAAAPTREHPDTAAPGTATSDTAGRDTATSGGAASDTATSAGATSGTATFGGAGQDGTATRDGASRDGAGSTDGEAARSAATTAKKARLPFGPRPSRAGSATPATEVGTASTGTDAAGPSPTATPADATTADDKAQQPATAEIANAGNEAVKPAVRGKGRRKATDADSTEQAEAGTAPESSTETSAAADSSGASGTAEAVSAAGSAAPKVGVAAPAVGTDASTLMSDMSDTGSDSAKAELEARTAAPEAETEAPDTGTDALETATEEPEAGADTPEAGAAAPGEGDDTPEAGVDVPEADSDALEVTGGTATATAASGLTEAGTNAREAGTDLLEAESNAREAGTDPPEAEADLTEAGTDAPEAGTRGSGTGTDTSGSGIGTDASGAGTGTDPGGAGTGPAPAGADVLQAETGDAETGPSEGGTATPDAEASKAALVTAGSGRSGTEPEEADEARAGDPSPANTRAGSIKASRKKSRGRTAAAATGAGAATPGAGAESTESPATDTAEPEADLGASSSTSAEPATPEVGTPRTAAFKAASPEAGTPTFAGDGEARTSAAGSDAGRTRIIPPAATPQRTRAIPVARARSAREAAAVPVSGSPAFGQPSRPAWQPMTVRAPSSGARGVTVFGTTLTRRQTVIAVGVLVAVLLALVVLIPRAFGGDSDDQAGGNGRKAGVAPAAGATGKPSAAPTSARAAGPASTTTATSAAPSTSASKPASTGKLPDGWYLYKGDGYSVPVPEGSQVRADGTETYFTKNNRLLIIDHSEQPKPDPVADWKAQEKERRGTKYRNYEQIRLDGLTYLGKAADWEFTYTTASGNPQHAVKRGFITTPGKQAYSISWYTSPEDWEASQADLQVIYQGFKADR